MQQGYKQPTYSELGGGTILSVIPFSLLPISLCAALIFIFVWLCLDSLAILALLSLSKQCAC